MIHRRMDNDKPYTYKNVVGAILLYVREKKHKMALRQSPDAGAWADQNRWRSQAMRRMFRMA